MKFTCQKEALDQQLQHASRIITIRHSLPVLSNLLLETDGKILRISGTDLELAIATTVDAQVKQEGAFTVPAKVFQEFVHQNPDEEVEIELVGNELVCRSKKVQARIAGIDPEEYPALPKVEEKQRLVLPAQPLADILRQVVIACATDPARPVLTGVYAEFKGEEAIFAATDSFRLVERRLKVVPIQAPVTLLIPSRTIQELIRIIGQMPELSDVEVILGEQQVLFRLGGIELYSRLLTGNFPKYQSIIPTSFVATAEVPTAELLQALRLATIFSQAGIANVLLEVDAEGTLQLSSYGSQRGTAKHTLYAVLQDGFTPIKVPFNARFLSDACNAVGTDHLQLRFSGVTSPLVVGTDDPAYVQLVMPIRLDS